jgi:cellulose synthase/poly-beta-1,6-N-acetylglucosamine synthase-like glycosyltransferase
MKNNKKISVIIPVYNDMFGLEKCLDALFKQTYDENLYEVIVVDNDSEEDIKALCARINKENLIYTVEKKKGSYAARNKGLSISRGKQVGFLDSDCVPKEDWLEKAVKILNSGGYHLLGGKVELFFKDSNNPTSVELYEDCFAFQQERNIKKKKVSVTANLFVKTEVFEETGFFDDTLLSGGDMEFCKRANEAGFQIGYTPNVVVLHPARSSWSDMRDKLTRVVGGKYKANKKTLLLKTILLMPMFKVYMVLSTEKYSFRDKLRIMLIIFRGQFVTIGETFRLIFGKNPER